MRALFVAMSLQAVLAGAGFAQAATWIVDAGNGPGTHFTDLPPAVAAAAPGDRLLVRSGDYTGFRLSKALRIVGSGIGATRVSSGGSTYQNLTIENLPAGARISIGHLTTSFAPPSTRESLTIASCQGAVVLDGVRSAAYTSIAGCANVRGSSCLFDGPVFATTSNVALDRCSLMGGPAGFLQNASGLNLSGGAAILSRCQAFGADTFVFSGFTYPASSAIALSGALLTLTGDGSGVVAAGTGAATPAISGNGTLDLDPNVRLEPQGGAPAAVPDVTTTVRAIPSLAVDAGPPGGTIDLDLFGAPGDVYCIYFGPATAPYPVPLIVGNAWINPIRQWTCGTFDATGRYTGQIPVLNRPKMTGFSLSWQALTSNAVSGLALSSPVSYVHGM